MDKAISGLKSTDPLSLLLSVVIGAAVGFSLARTLPGSGWSFKPAPEDDEFEGDISDSEDDMNGDDSDSDDESDEEEDGPEPCKMVLVVRHDLKMGKGKVAAQCGHATLGTYRRAIARPACRQWVRTWKRGQKKVVLKAPNEARMDEVEAALISLGVPTYFVVDAGRTQVASGSKTVLGIGPAPESLIDSITGRAGSHPLALLS